MKNTDFMNLSLPEGADKIDVEILNNDFKKLESEASKHYIKQQIEVDGTATIIGSIGPYVQLENLTDNILNVRIGDELVILTKGDNRKIRTISGENYGVVTSGAVRITYYINARTYADENFYKKEKVDELIQNVEANVEVDAELSETSENPVQNKVINAKFKEYYNSEEVNELIDGIGTPEDVYTKTETDNKITEKVSEIVAGAPEDFDTLKEMSDWLTEHEGSAAEMNTAIQQNKTDILSANAEIAKKVDKVIGKSLVSDSEIERLADVDNYDDTAVKNDIKNVKSQATINQMTLGTQCKNLLPYRCVPHSNSGGIKVAVADDGVVTLSGTNTVPFTYNINFTTPMVFDRDVFIVGAETLKNVRYNCKVDIKVNGSDYPAIGTAGLRIPAGTTISYLYFQQQTTNKEIEATIAPMIVYADVLDKTYEPYKPSLQEQINTLLARIEALEGTTNTTTEGGE